MIIRDAVHGSIEASDLEEKIIDTPEFQRLRFVYQLATAHWVYPSATHTRFDHSIGTMHLTGILGRRLGLSGDEQSMLRLAALLHDVGQPAFSHLGDEVLMERGKPSHEERGIQLIRNGRLGELVEEAGFSVRELASLMEGKGMGALITENLGMDRLDYLLRDAHHCGVGYAFVDRDRLLETLVLHKGAVKVHEKGFMTAESLLVSRYFMFGVVYRHPVTRLTAAMLQKALRAALAEGELEEPELEKGMDLEVLTKLRDSGSGIASRLLERRLFKKAVMLRMHDASPKARRFLLSKGVAEKLSKHLLSSGVAEDSFVVCPLPYEKSVRDVEVVMRDGRVVRLDALSPILRALGEESLRRSLIVACEKNLVPKVSKAVNSYLAGL